MAISYKIAVRPDADGMGYELYSEYFGLTCTHELFQGHYDLWPFCKPYNAEEWWLFDSREEAECAAKELTKYLENIPHGHRISPPRIGFIQDADGFHLHSNGEIVGTYIFKGEDDKMPWPFPKGNWINHKSRGGAMKAMLSLQQYLDVRTSKLANAKKK